MSQVTHVLGAKCLQWPLPWVANVLDGKCLGWQTSSMALSRGAKWLGGIMKSGICFGWRLVWQTCWGPNYRGQLG